MTTRQKLAAGFALLVLLGGGAAWIARPSPSPVAAPADETAQAEPAEPKPVDERRRVASDAPAPVAAETTHAIATTEDEPIQTTPKAPSHPERQSLSFTILRYVAPRSVPEGYTELQPGEEPVIEDVGEALGAPGPRMLPYWRRWAPIPERGTVTFRGRVTDASGRGIADAEVFRVKLDETGRRDSPSSFQWITTLTRTADDGRFEAREQPAGSFLIAADWNGAMRRRRGLDLGGAVPASAADGEALSGLDVRLPVETARLATVRGVVHDEHGKAKRNVQVNGPMQRLYTDADGRFEMRGLQPGSVTVSASSTGYAPARVTLDLSPGAAEEVELSLTFAEPGDLVLEGRVLDEQDVPVADVPVFLAASRAGSRWARTDTDGTFRFASLAAKHAKTPVKVMVSPHPERDLVKSLGPPQEVTVPSPGLTLRVQRSTRLHVLLRDAESGDPLPLYAISTEMESVVDGVSVRRNFHSMSHYDEAGEATFVVPRGRFRLTVRAKDHRGVEVEVDIPDALTPKEIRIDMERAEAE